MGGKRIGALIVALAVVVGVVWVDQGTSWAQTPGSELRQDVTATDPADGGSVRVQSVEPFDASGGEAVFQPGTAQEESFSYAGFDTSDNQLTNVTRTAPQSHPSGSFVEAVAVTEPSPSPSGEATPTAEDSPSPQPTAPEPAPGAGTENTEPDQGPDSTSGTTATSPATGTTSSTNLGADTVEELVYMLCQETLRCDQIGGPDMLIKEILAADPLCKDVPVDECLLDNIDIGPLLQEILLIVDRYRFELCGYRSWETCLLDVVESLDLQSLVCGPNVEWPACADRYYAAIDWLLKGLCQGSYYSSGTQDCIDMVGRIAGKVVDDLFYTVCGSDPWWACADRYNAAIDGLLKSLCQGSYYSSGTQDCVDMIDRVVTKAINDLYYAICGPNDMSGCQGKYSEAIEGLLKGLCQGSYYSSGTQDCIDMVGRIAGKVVDDLFYAVCGSDPWWACADRYNAAIEGLLKGLCDGSYYSSGTQDCIDLISRVAGEAIDDLYYTICGPNDMSGCQAKYNEAIEALLNAVCSSTSSSGTQACIDMIVRIVGTYCHNLECSQQAVDNLTATIYALLLQQCGGGGGVLDCEQKLEDTIFGIIDTYCYNLQCGQDSINDVTRIVNGLLLQYCAGDAALDCERMVAATIFGLIETYCPALRCPSDVANQIVAIVSEIVSVMCSQLGSECTAFVQALVDQLLASFCPGGVCLIYPEVLLGPILEAVCAFGDCDLAPSCSLLLACTEESQEPPPSSSEGIDYEAPTATGNAQEVYDHHSFIDRSGDQDGVDDRYLSDNIKPDGSYRRGHNFERHELNEQTEDRVQHLRIRPIANNDGDVGMYKGYSAGPNQWFKAQAWVWPRSFDYPFKARLTIHFWDSADHSAGVGLLRECNGVLAASPWQTGYARVETGCQDQDSRISAMDAAARANNGDGCDSCREGEGYGSVWLDRMRLVRES